MVLYVWPIDRPCCSSGVFVLSAIVTQLRFAPHDSARRGFESRTANPSVLRTYIHTHTLHPPKAPKGPSCNARVPDVIYRY